MNDLVAAEWLKLRTTRVLFGALPAAVALSCAAVAGAVLSEHRAGVELESAEGIRRVLSVTGTGAILVLVVGILISAGEHRHGTASDTFLTTPRRHRVVTAKLAVGAGLGLATGIVIAVVATGSAIVFYDLEGARFPIDAGEVWATLTGSVVYVTLFAVLGVALGSLIRNQVVAVAGALAWLAVVEHTLVNLAPDVGRWLPAGAGQAIVGAPVDGLLSRAAGAVLLTLYTAAIALFGVRVAATRDA